MRGREKEEIGERRGDVHNEEKIDREGRRRRGGGASHHLREQRSEECLSILIYLQAKLRITGHGSFRTFHRITPGIKQRSRNMVRERNFRPMLAPR
jgi:hypothetical protein